MLLKATERNWGLIGPGTWEKRTWKINSDGISLQIFDSWITHDVRPGREEERWINLLARKA